MLTAGAIITSGKLGPDYNEALNKVKVRVPEDEPTWPGRSCRTQHVHASTHAHPHPTQSVLYLATDQGADKALEPDGFATLQASAGASGAHALKHVPMDVKVMVWTGGGRGLCGAGSGKIRIWTCHRSVKTTPIPKTEPLLRARRRADGRDGCPPRRARARGLLFRGPRLGRQVPPPGPCCVLWGPVCVSRCDADPTQINTHFRMIYMSTCGVGV